MPDLYRALADMVLILHVAFVAFVVGGLLLILTGGFRGWGWVRNPWFRAAHLAGIAVVVLQAWFWNHLPAHHLGNASPRTSWRPDL